MTSHGSPPGDNDATISSADTPAADGDTTISRPDHVAPRASAGPTVDSISGYRIIGTLGQGGMGTVWEAEQQRPRRRVALKVMRRDHLVDEFHQRMFQREAEVLARLKHPNIAAIYASGHTDDGHDFFAMELVAGPTLRDWLGARPDRLDNSELKLRLRLFLQICDAVHYAHQRGVIHRDLKPGNIIVADDDGSSEQHVSHQRLPAVKVLDFGLARITDADVAVTTVSEIGMIKGTLQYMSPEQARGEIDAIDTRTDVYALGVLLYELLAARRPYEVTSTSIAEAVRLICEQRPTPLRQAVGGPHRLDADLETIVGKALEKEADRRYASVAALSDDLQRYLASQPIDARPPSTLYQLRKFAARNRALVAGAAAAVLLLAAFAATMAVQAERIRREAERANREAANARQVSEFLIHLFDRSDPTLARGDELTAREILDAGADRIETLGDQPLTQAAFMETMGRVFNVLGEFDRAEPLLEAAVAIHGRSGSDQRLRLAQSLHHWASLLDNLGRYLEAEDPIRRALEIRKGELGESPEVCQSLNVLGNVLWHQGRLDEAEEVHRRALEIRERILPPDHTDIAQSLHNLGAMLYFDGDLAAAERMWRRSAEIEEAAGGPDNWNLATSLHTLAIAVSDQGRLDEALDLEMRSLAIREKVLGPDHPHVALSLTTLGNIYRELGRGTEAEPLIRRAVEVASAAHGEDYPEVFWMRTSLARTLIALERWDDAERELTDQLADLETAGVASELPPCLEALGLLYTRIGQFAEAERSYLRAIALTEEESPGNPNAGRLLAGLARSYRDAGRTDEAIAAFRRSAELMRDGWGDEDADYLDAARDLAKLERRIGS